MTFPSGILNGIVATLDAAVEVAPEGAKRVVPVGFEVEQTVPVLVADEPKIVILLYSTNEIG